MEENWLRVMCLVKLVKDGVCVCVCDSDAGKGWCVWRSELRVVCVVEKLVKGVVCNGKLVKGGVCDGEAQ